MKLYTMRQWRAADGSPRVAWQASFTCPATGTRVRRTLKVQNEREAAAAASLLYAEMQRRAVAMSMGLAPGPTREQSSLTVAGMLEADRRRAGIAPATRRLEEDNARRLIEALGARHVASLTVGDIEAFKRRGVAAGLKPRSVNLPLQILKAAIRRAVADDRLVAEPCPIKKLPDRPKPKRPLNRREAVALIDAARKVGIGDVVVVLLNTGLRRAELYRLTWGDVDGERETIDVRTAKRGGGADYANDTIPLNRPALDVLRERRSRLFPDAPPNPGSLIFGKRPEDRRESPLRKSGRPKGSIAGVETERDHRLASKLRRAAGLAGIESPERVTPHLLRHSCATLLIESGVLIHHVQRIMRHRDPSTTLACYLHASPEGLRDAVDRLGLAAPERLGTKG